MNDLTQIIHFNRDMETRLLYYRMLKVADGVSWLRVVIITYMLLLYFVPLHAALYQYNFFRKCYCIKKDDVYPDKSLVDVKQQKAVK